MPFVSDEQRKAAFANMNRRGGGGGGRNAPRRGPTTPSDPKKKKKEKEKVNNYGDYGTGNGYAGNFTAGLPNYSNWYQSLPNTTGATPAVTQSGSSMPGGYSSQIQIVDFLTAEQFYGLRSDEQSLWSAYYDIFVRQRDPDDGEFIQPPGTPGTITIAASMLYGTGFANLSYNPNLGILSTGGPDARDRLTVGGYNTIYQAQQEGAFFPGTPYSNSNPGNNVDSVYTQYLRDIGMIE